MAFTGYTTKTKENIQFDSGAYYINYNVGTDTPATATTKLLGATENGGNFTAKAEIINFAVDGVHGDVKGMELISRWDVNMTTSTFEVTPQNLRHALGSADITTDAKNSIITGRIEVKDADYLDNITFIGRMSGSQDPIIIQVLNAKCNDGLVLESKPNGRALISLNFKGHFDDATIDKPPFKIYYPKAAVLAK